MVKTHNCLVEIKNDTLFDMKYVRAWYSSGQVAYGSRWADVVSDGHLRVNNYERVGALPECSGYVTYQIGGTEFSIAFSNPFIGTNKLGVGLDGVRTWVNMSYHNYEPFIDYVDLGGELILVCNCVCTGGNTNNCFVKVGSQLNAGARIPDACACPLM